MIYKVKPVVCDYGVYGCKDDEEKLIDIFNLKSNAQLVADILNADLSNTRYEVVKRSKIDDMVREIQYERDNYKRKQHTGFAPLDVMHGMNAALEIVNNHIGGTT